jgi:hypothetical protein
MKHKYRIIKEQRKYYAQRRSWCYTWRYYNDNRRIKCKWTNVFLRKLNCDDIEIFSSIDDAKKVILIDKIFYDKNEALLNIRNDDYSIREYAEKKLKESEKPEIIYV